MFTSIGICLYNVAIKNSLILGLKVGIFQDLLDKITGKKQNTNSNAPQSESNDTKNLTEKKPDAAPTIGRAPAQHAITQKELEKLVKTASTEEVQALIQNIAPIFNPELNNPAGKKKIEHKQTH
jgi:hypothetical protein